LSARGGYRLEPLETLLGQPRRKQVAVPGIIIYRIADGKIVEHWMLVDSTVRMQQLGVQS